MAYILCIEHDKPYCGVLSGLLHAMGHEVTCADTLERGLLKVREHDFDIVLLGTALPDGNGLDSITDVLDAPGKPDIIIITDFRTHDDARTAIEKGAWCYIHKKFSKNELTLLIINILQYRSNKTRYPDQDQARLEDTHFEDIIGSSPAIKFCKFLAASVANINANVLITGETGTGKELFARAIHKLSPRARNNFVTVDCTAIPKELIESILFGYEKGAFTGALKFHEGLIQQADGGTLFLDEVGELPLPMQSSLLRVIQERRFRPVGCQEETESDFRLIAASHRDLENMVSQGQFRNDLLFRLRAFAIEVPPLKKHANDINELVPYYTSKLCRKFGLIKKSFHPGFLHALHAYIWPGNVRELIHALESSLIAAQSEPTLFSKHLPHYIRIWLTRTSIQVDTTPEKPRQKVVDTTAFHTLKQVRDNALADTEAQYLKELLRVSKGDLNAARRLSGLSRTRLYVLLKKYKISTAV